MKLVKAIGEKSDKSFISHSLAQTLNCCFLGKSTILIKKIKE